MRRDLSDPAGTAPGRHAGHPQQVEGRFLVRVRGAQRGHDRASALGRDDHLDPGLGHGLDPARRPDRRLRAVGRTERAGALGRPRAALVVAEPTGAGGRERIDDAIGRLDRHEHDQLVEVLDQRLERAQIAQAQPLGQRVRDAGVGNVGVRVGDEVGDPKLESSDARARPWGRRPAPRGRR